MSKNSDIVAAEIYRRVKEINYKADGAAYTKFAQWVRERMAAYEDHVRGKAPMEVLKGKMPVVLYFDSEQDRQDFILAVKFSNPNLETRKLPPAT